MRVFRAQNQEDLERVFRFRYDIYVDEVQYTHKADHKKRLLNDEWDQYGHNFALEHENEIMGSLRILFMHEVPSTEPFLNKFGLQPAIDGFGSHSICTTSRFMIHPRFRNGKAVFKLMRAAYRFTVNHGARLNFGDCSPHLIPFYEHMGYRRYTDGFNDSSYGYKIPILMILRDHGFLYEVKSLLYKLAREKPDDEEARYWFKQTYPDYVTARSAVHLEENAFMDLLTERLASDPVHHVALLQHLAPHEAENFLAEATLFPCKPGDLIIRKGDIDGSVYVLLKGLAKVMPELDGPHIAILGAGDTFGEMGFLTESPRSANVIAQTEGEVLVMTREFLDRFIRQKPEIASKVLLNLSRELAARLLRDQKN